MTPVKFSFTQNLQTLHPDCEIQVEYSGVAHITENVTLIKSLYATHFLLLNGVNMPNINGEIDPPNVRLEIPGVYLKQYFANGAMGRLLGMCREAAREELYRREQAEQKIKEENEYAPERADFSKQIMPLEPSEA